MFCIFTQLQIEFFLHKWPASLSKVMAAKTEDEKCRALASFGPALQSAFGIFVPKPPPPIKSRQYP
jgi:hypothetical protein